jgi:hypothetical protein
MKSTEMKSTDWIKVLESEVEKRFDESQVDGFEDSAPIIKYGILCEMYEEDFETNDVSKELAYDELARRYEVSSAWN